MTNDDDLHAPRLTAPPATSPVIRGAAVAVVTVALAVGGCGPNNPGAPPVDASHYVTGVDTGPITDAYVTPDVVINGVDTGPVSDAGTP